MATSKAQQAWDALNERQQTYLEALYSEDQALEAERARGGALGHYSSTPARAWRRIHFNGVYSPVVYRLRAAGVYDTGAGATLAALSTRGLIETENQPGLLNDQVYIWLTRAGRAAYRAHRGVLSAQAGKPKWALSESMWKAMVRVADAGAAGLPTSELWNAAHLYLVGGGLMRGNRSYLDVVTTHVPFELMDFNRASYNPPSFSSAAVRRYHLSAEGRIHYTEHLDAYRELYPDIDAPDLPAPADTAGTNSNEGT